MARAATGSLRSHDRSDGHVIPATIVACQSARGELVRIRVARRLARRAARDDPRGRRALGRLEQAVRRGHWTALDAVSRSTAWLASTTCT